MENKFSKISWRDDWLLITRIAEAVLTEFSKHTAADYKDSKYGINIYETIKVIPALQFLLTTCNLCFSAVSEKTELQNLLKSVFFMTQLCSLHFSTLCFIFLNCVLFIFQLCALYFSTVCFIYLNSVLFMSQL